MSLRLRTLPRFQFYHGGVPADGYLVYTYEPDGGFSNEKATYTTDDGGTPNANPIVLNAQGEAQIWWDGIYDIKITDPDGVQIYTEENYGAGEDLINYGNLNLINDGSFEVDEVGDGVPDNWTCTAYTLGTVAIDSTTQSHGLNSLKFTSGGFGGGYADSSIFEFAEGEIIAGAFDLISSTATVRNKVDVIWLTSAQATISTTNLYDDNTGNPTSWTTKTFSATAPTNTRYAKIRIYGVHATSGAVYLGTYTRYDNIFAYNRTYLFTAGVDIGDPGSESSGVNVNGTTYTHVLRVNDFGDLNPAGLVLHRHSTTIGTTILGTRSNSADSTHGTVTSGQDLFNIYGGGWTGSHYDLFGQMKIGVGTGTVSSTSSPGKWTLQLAPDGSNTLADVIAADSDKSVVFSGNVSVGNVALESWDSNFAVLQIGPTTSVADYNGDTAMLNRNAYNDGSWKYQTTEAATRYYQTTAGDHKFAVASSGTADTAISFTTAMIIYNSGGVVVGSPTGGDKGAGTINATAVYDDNTLLTCYVFDAAVDGSINETKWNDKVPDIVIKNTDGSIKETHIREHIPMQLFNARLGTAEDPLDIDAYANHWKTKKHLTSMPNETTFTQGDMSAGEWVQRLVEAVEIQAVLIEGLNQRLKILEAV